MKHKDVCNFAVHVSDHCNLNCAGCGHFAPLAKEGFLNPSAFEKDCLRAIKRNVKRGGFQFVF